jgi:chromosome segregation ATPase
MEATRTRDDLEKDFLSSLSSEQSRLQHQIDEATREKNEIDQRALAALLDLRQQHDSELDKLRHQHQQRIDEILKNNEEDRKSLMEKGKQLIKKHLTDHEHKLKEMEMKCRETEEKCEVQLDLMKKKMDAFENEAKTKLTATQKAYQSSQERQRVLQDKCEGLEEECGLLKREKSTLENEIDRQRRRRVGSDNGQGYLQYERLQREYQTILNENRKLKEQLHEKNARSLESGQNALKPSSKQNSWADVWATSSSLSLAELRSGYEEEIASLTDEKRELIMKNAAFMTDAKKAQQQVCELEETMSRLHDELTSVKLKLERATEQEL